MTFNLIYPFILVLISLYTSTYFLKKDISFLLAFNLIGIPLFIYLFSIFGLFYWGYIICVGIILISFIVALLKSKLKNDYFFNRNLVYIMLIIIFLLYWNRGRYFYQWDEFTHWGLMVKEMFRLNDLYSIDASHLIAHKDYPPIIPIYETFWLKTVAIYHEPAIYQSLQFLGFSYFLPLLSKKKYNILGFLLIFGSLIIYQGLFDLEDAKFFMTIYLDPILFLTFFYFIYIIYSSDDSIFSIIHITITGSFLLLLKEMGVFLYALGLMVWFIKKLVNAYKFRMAEVFQWLIPILFLTSWSVYFSQYNYVGQFSANQISLSTLFEIMNGTGGLDWQVEAYYNFLDSLSTLNILNLPIKLNIYSMNAFFIILSFLISLSMNKKDKQHFMITSLFLIIASFAYAFVMLLLYVFSFGPFEGPRLASVMRYMSSYWYGLGAFLLMIWLSNIKSSKHLYIKTVTFMTVISLFFFNESKFTRIKADTHEDNFETYFTNDTYRIRNETEINSKIYFIAQDEIANYLNYFRYLVNDRIFNVGGFNIGNIDENSDPWKVDFSSKEFLDAVSDYDYLYIYKMNNEFYERFFRIMPSNFYVQDHQLLKIIHTDDSVVFEVLFPN